MNGDSSLTNCLTSHVGALTYLLTYVLTLSATLLPEGIPEIDAYPMSFF